MPKLLTFVSCEKVVEDKKSGNVSLFNILEQVNVTIPPEIGPPPAETALPMDWVLFSLWEREMGEEGQSFDVSHNFVASNGAALMPQNGITITFDKPRHRIMASIRGFPIWITGRCEVRISMRRSSPGAEFEQKGAFPISIFHISGTTDATNPSQESQA